VPIRQGTKAPSDADWLKRVYNAQDFTEQDNIGVKNGAQSGWRVDVDCDCVEAATIAHELLPKTRVHGRAGRRHAHHWFIAEGTASEAFKDLDGKMLVEIRSTGGQTVVPPSKHPSGEGLEWENATGEKTLTKDELRDAVRLIAVGALVARHWPQGSRHHLCGALGGFLARAGVEPVHIGRLVGAITIAAGEGTSWAEENARYARDSAEKHARGDKTTGGPTLKEILGDDALERLNTWFGRTDDDALDALNTEHFVVQIGKDMVVGTETADSVLFQPFTNFEQRYYNRFIGRKKLGRAWLEHPGRRTFRQIVFAPPPVAADPRDYNLWRGFAVQPDTDPNPEDRCPRYLEHVREVIANGVPAHAEYILDLLAVTVQQPGVPTGKALALRGGQGVGKSVMLRGFGQLFGRHFVTVSSRKHITGDFNAHLSGRVVVFADEAVWGGNRQDIGTLKRLVTERTIVIERKGLDVVEERNCIHLFMATNDQWIWPAGAQERRGVILDVTVKRSPAYFDKLWTEVDDPKAQRALLGYLLARDVSAGRWRGMLDTDALQHQQYLTSNDLQQWWMMKLDDGAVGPDATWPAFLATADAYDDFLRDWGPRARTYLSRYEFARQWRALLPTQTTSETRRVQRNFAAYGPPIWKLQACRGLVLPSLALCRQFFDRLKGTATPWPETDAAAPLLQTEEGEDL
jgi:hypothetical protein